MTNTFKKKKILLNGFITSQFSYCPLVWMSHSRIMNNRINQIHEKTLRLVHKDEKNLFLDDLLKKDKLVSIHQKNLQILATKIYKARNDLGPEIMKDIFHSVQKAYNLRKSFNSAKAKKPDGVLWNRKHISLAPKIWEIVPCEIKNAKPQDIFLKKRKLWTTDKCPSRLCKRHIGNVGFISSCSKEIKNNYSYCHFIIFF